MSKLHIRPAGITQSMEDPIPPVFCWTKMGTEAGQNLNAILRRKEMERRAGGGVFAWGIGNSLGVAPRLAQQELQKEAVDVLFTPMKSAAKQIDTAPSQVLLWTGYVDERGGYVRLPDHMVITSRGNLSQAGRKRSHYALICNGSHDITKHTLGGVIDANKARNFLSLNPLGASQVTAVVRYQSQRVEVSENFYPVSFRAKLHGMGFVRLAFPVVLDRQLAELYHQICNFETPDEWVAGSQYLRRMAETQIAKCLPQQQHILEESKQSGKRRKGTQVADGHLQFTF